MSYTQIAKYSYMNNFEWKNKNNAIFYDQIPKELFDKTALESGLNSGCDIDILQPYINSARTILEIGSGYGRVVQYILQFNFAGKLYALERNHKMCEHLRENFCHSVDIIEQDVFDFKTEKKFDLILACWTTICEFSKEEQSVLIKKLSNMLTADGKLVFDSIFDKPRNSSYCNCQNHVVHNEYSSLYGYIPSLAEIKAYALDSNFKTTKIIYYITDSNRERAMFVLSNNTDVSNSQNLLLENVMFA